MNIKPGAIAQTNNPVDHPNLWRASEMQTAGVKQNNLGIATGYSELDQHLANRGWPQNGLTEFLLPTTGTGEVRLLLPALKMLSHQQNRWVALANPPFMPYAPALLNVGVDINKILLITPPKPASADSKNNIIKRGGLNPNARARSGSRNRKNTSHHWQNVLWATERACKSGSCSVVLAWLHEKHFTLKDSQRLQVAAKAGNTFVCLMRPTVAAHKASMAELRIGLSHTDEVGKVDLNLLKRRGGWPIEKLRIDIAHTTDTQHRQTEQVMTQLNLWREHELQRQNVDTLVSDTPITDQAQQNAQRAPLNRRANNVFNPQAVH